METVRYNLRKLERARVILSEGKNRIVYKLNLITLKSSKLE